METLGNAYDLMARGRFTAAMGCLERLPVARLKTLEAETLRVELLERSGRFDEAEELSRRLRKSRSISDTQRSVCEFSTGMILWEQGETGAAVEYFQRAVASAEKGNDLWRTCWAQLRLFVSLSGKTSSLPGSRPFRELRQNIIRLADPVVSAALHVFLGELEAKRGLFATSCRHTTLGQSLLKLSLIHI